MNLAMNSCPSCHQLVLNDTPECPSCGHVFDAGTASQPAKSTWSGSNDEEKECSSCNEMVRVGLVRCWNCGAFMDEQIAESYRQRLAKPRPMIYSVSEEDMVESTADVAIEHARSSSTRRREMVPDAEVQSNAGGEDDLDFEISENVTIKTESSRPATRARDKKSKPSNPVQVHNPQSDADSSTYSIAGGQEEEKSESTTEQANPSVEQTTAAPAGESTTEGKSGTAAPATVGDESGVPHSEATAGDVLLNVALQEEVETQQRQQDAGKRRRRRGPSPDGLIVFCPNGHRIEVKEKHRGMSGRCPRCKSLFIVPEQVYEQKPDTVESSGASPAVAEQTRDPHGLDAGSYTRGMNDVDLLVVDPQKLKLKPGSLIGTEVQHDLYFSDEHVLLVNLVKKGGLFGGADKKKQGARETLLAQMKEGKPAAELTVASQLAIPVEVFRQIMLVQPVQFEHESMFAGVPVFGEHRMAVLLPKVEGMAFPHYLSFTLSRYREFCRIIRELYGIDNLGENLDIPLRDEFEELKCHYTDQVMHVLKNVDYYRVDKSFTLQLVGRKCQGCGLIVSEDGRKKEKIGGKNGKGIAKHKCPKCIKPFGDISLYTLVETKEAKPETGETPESETADESLGANASTANATEGATSESAGGSTE